MKMKQKIVQAVLHEEIHHKKNQGFLFNYVKQKQFAYDKAHLVLFQVPEHL